MGEATPDSKCNGKTAKDLNMELLEAAEILSLPRVQSLIEAGASAAFVHDPPDNAAAVAAKSTKSALHVAISSGRGDKWEQAWPIVESLIAAKADVNAPRHEYDWRGCGASLSAFEMVLPHAMKDVKVLETFLNAGANANTESVRHRHSMRTDGTEKHSALHTAVHGGDLEIARALLDAGAAVDAVASDISHNERGHHQHKEETALHQACARGDLAMVALLLARGASVDKVRLFLDQEAVLVESPTDDPREDGYVCPVRCVSVVETPAHIAIRNKNSNLLLMLVCTGADVGVARVRGDVSTSSADLCDGNEELLTALKAEWTPETHQFFPAEVQESVKTALLIAQRQQWPLPDAVLFKALAMATHPGAHAAGS